MSRALVFGSLNIDTVLHTDHIVCGGETEASFGLEKNAGGKGLNQAIALARAGAETHFAGCVGQDGAFLRELLEENGIRTEQLQAVDQPNGSALIQVDRDGQNAILLYGGSNQAVTEEQIDRTLEAFAPGDLLVIQNEISCGEYLFRRACAKGLRTAVNPSPITPDLMKWPLEKASYLFVNETEGGLLTGEDDIPAMTEALARIYPDTEVILTLGEKGARGIRGGRVFRQDAFPVKAADTTAAGDTFTGYYLAAAMNGLSVPEALRRAAAASAIAVSRPGAAPSIPTADEVDAMPE